MSVPVWVRVKKRDRHPLHVVEEPDSQVIDKTLADTARQVPLDQAEDSLPERRGDQEEEEDVDVAAIAVNDRVVENLADQQRGQQAEERRDNDRAEEPEDRSFVRLGEGEDASPGLLGDGLAIERRTVRGH